MIITSLDSLRLPYLDRKEASLIAEVSPKTISNMADREIVLRNVGGLFHLGNALEVKVIDAVSTAGSTMQVSKLVAAAAVTRMDMRLDAKILGSRSSLEVLVYVISGAKTRARGFVSHGGISASFCDVSEVGAQVSARIEAGAKEVRIFPVDDVIETMMENFKKAGGTIL